MYRWLKHIEDPGFPINQKIRPSSPTDYGHGLDYVRQLHSLTKGLLEVVAEEGEWYDYADCAPYMRYKVQFFHTTVLDYIEGGHLGQIQQRNKNLALPDILARLRLAEYLHCGNLWYWHERWGFLATTFNIEMLKNNISTAVMDGFKVAIHQNPFGIAYTAGSFLRPYIYFEKETSFSWPSPYGLIDVNISGSVKPGKPDIPVWLVAVGNSIWTLMGAPEGRVEKSNIPPSLAVLTLFENFIPDKQLCVHAAIRPFAEHNKQLQAECPDYMAECSFTIKDLITLKSRLLNSSSSIAVATTHINSDLLRFIATLRASSRLMFSPGRMYSIEWDNQRIELPFSSRIY
ncbi:hypothetical protein QBC38DRAFT_286345 [Podospora fimiseda]|uniref:Uncharacterized protein n=1 Tax=Podospora fimiseda TaxID=252190 RepID=A0AAN7BJX8_9PEZI|nr:hypothetical protein QBC38DRAFT_286345 [Podospora fimiseda]